MEDCEICGKRSDDIYVVNVEEAELRVCTKCAKGKKIVSKVVERKATPKGVGTVRRGDIEQLVENYGAVIHDARERMKLPVKVLAEMINEKETHLLHVEQQRTRPSEELRKKLERALSVRLVEPSQGADESVHGKGGGDSVTLGDFITKKHK
jgi:putative transcription factor